MSYIFIFVKIVVSEERSEALHPFWSIDSSSMQTPWTTILFFQGQSLYLQNENWLTWLFCFLLQIGDEISQLHLEELTKPISVTQL